LFGGGPGYQPIISGRGEGGRQGGGRSRGGAGLGRGEPPFGGARLGFLKTGTHKREEKLFSRGRNGRRVFRRFFLKATPGRAPRFGRILDSLRRGGIRGGGGARLGDNPTPTHPFS